MLNTDSGSSTTDFNYDISDKSCIVINGLLISKKAGTSQIIMTKKGYSDISKQIIVKINKIQQDNLLFENINSNNNIFINPNIEYNLSIKGIKENANYTVKLNNKDICEVANNYLYGLSEGSCDIYFITDETENYLATKSNIITIFVNKNNQSEIDISLSTKLKYKSSVDVYTIGGSTLEDTIFYLDNNNGKIVNNTIIGLQSGISELSGTKLGNFMYYDINQTLKVNVVPIKQYNIKVTDINYENEVSVDLSTLYPLNINNYKENPKIIFKAIHGLTQPHS
jgi:hypothetical protein